MNSVVRFIAATMLIFMVPVQAGAAACAQLCATAAFQHDALVITVGDHDDSSDGQGSPAEETMRGHHCDKSDAAGKCCQGHTAMTHGPSFLAAVVIPAFEPRWFVARWTNFIPEEPSPPPISSSRAA